MTPNPRAVERLLSQAKSLAKKYRDLTGKPLGITGEIAEFYASKYLKLTLATAREPGYDAVVKEGGKTVRIQIKGRCIPKGAKPSQRLGAIKLANNWDRVILVLLDEDLEITEIFQAERKQITQELKKPGSKARKRGALGVNKFKAIGKSIWKENIRSTTSPSSSKKRRQSA